MSVALACRPDLIGKMKRSKESKPLTFVSANDDFGLLERSFQLRAQRAPPISVQLVRHGSRKCRQAPKLAGQHVAKFIVVSRVERSARNCQRQEKDFDKMHVRFSCSPASRSP